MAGLKGLSLVIIFLVSGCVSVFSVSGEFGDPSDAYLKWSVSGGDFSADTDGNNKWEGFSMGGPVTLSGEMTVTVPKGYTSGVSMDCYLDNQKWKGFPKEGEDGNVKGEKTITRSFSLTVTPVEGAPYVMGRATLRKCGGVCTEYSPWIIIYPEGGGTFSSSQPTSTTTTTIPSKCKTEGDSGADFIAFGGMVIVYPDDDPEDTRPAMLGDTLKNCDHIVTHADSSAILGFLDMTTFHMKPESHIILDIPSERKAKVDLIWGNIKINFKKMLKDGSMDVGMTQGICGVKGTELVLIDDGMNSTVKVLEGDVNFTSHATGESINVSAGQMVSATSSGLSAIQSFNVAAEEDNWKGFDQGIDNGWGGDWIWFLVGGGIIILVGLVFLIIIIFLIIKKRR